MRRSIPYKWLVVAMLWCICLFNYADRQAIYSVFDPIKEEMGLTDGQLGVVGSSFMWVYAAAAPLAGLVGDRLRRKTLILGGLIFWSAICAATALSTRYWHLVTFRALEGFGEAFYFPASMALVSAYHGRETRSRAMGFHQSSVYVGTILGGALAGYLADLSGWRSSFYLLGAVGALLGIVLIFCLREPPAEPSQAAPPREALADVWSAAVDFFANTKALLLTAVFFGANMVAAIFLTWMPTFLKREFKLSLTLAGWSSTAYLQSASIVGVVIGGVLADRLAARHRGGRMLTQALGLWAGAPFIFLVGWTTSTLVVVLAMASFGLAKGLYDANIWASLHDVVRPERRASAVGFMNGFAWVGGALGTLLVGHASDRFGLRAAISATALLYIASGLLLVAGARLLSRPSDESEISGPQELRSL